MVEQKVERQHESQGPGLVAPSGGCRECESEQQSVSSKGLGQGSHSWPPAFPSTAFSVTKWRDLPLSLGQEKRLCNRLRVS